MTGKLSLKKLAGSLLAVGLLSATLMAETNAASRYDNQVQNAVTQKLAAKSTYNNVTASVEDGIVSLTGTVDLYQRKLDAGKVARKTANAQGVRNLITVAGPNVPDSQLEQKLAKKLNYVREGYDSTFDYFAARSTTRWTRTSLESAPTASSARSPSKTNCRCRRANRRRNGTAVTAEAPRASGAFFVLSGGDKLTKVRPKSNHVPQIIVFKELKF